MLGKLLRYEFKFYLRILPTLYAALAVLSLIMGLDKAPLLSSMEFNPLWVLWIFMVVALCTIFLVLLIQRFRDNLLKDEAYLMLTLPVPSWALVAAKAIAAFCVSLVSLLVILLSLLIAMVADDPGNIPGVFEALRVLLSQFDTGVLISAWVVMLILGVQQGCLIYAAMTATHALPRFGGLAAWGAYLGTWFLVIQPVNKVVSRLAGGSDLSAGGMSLTLGPAVTGVNVVQAPAVLGTLAGNIVNGLVALAFTALFFALASFLLKRTVNLE
jgi:hypothetical protein